MFVKDVHAGTGFMNFNDIPDAHVDGVATIKGFEVIFNNIAYSVLFAGAILLFIMLTLGGFRYITAGDNPKGAEAARKLITYAIMGIVVLAASYLVLLLISAFTGNTSILNFSVVVVP